MSASTSTESFEAYRVSDVGEGPLYKHGIHTNLYESNTKKHSRKRFYRCPYWQVKGKDYGFFKWLDLVQNESIWAIRRELEDVKLVPKGLKTRCEVL